jgi:hypothetical protein
MNKRGQERERELGIEMKGEKERERERDKRCVRVCGLRMYDDADI